MNVFEVSKIFKNIFDFSKFTKEIYVFRTGNSYMDTEIHVRTSKEQNTVTVKREEFYANPIRTAYNLGFLYPVIKLEGLNEHSDISVDDLKSILSKYLMNVFTENPDILNNFKNFKNKSFTFLKKGLFKEYDQRQEMSLNVLLVETEDGSELSHIFELVSIENENFKVLLTYKYKGVIG